MKNKLFLLIFIGVTTFYSSCKQENKPTENSNQPVVTTSNDNSSGKALWAEQVESSLALTVPDDWAPEDWNRIYKNIDRKKIYSDISEAVLSGKQQAYNFFTDSVYTTEQVKAIIAKTDTNKVSLIRIREKVYFDKENFKLEQIPHSLILYTNHYSDDGTFRGYQALFYVKLNN